MPDRRSKAWLIGWLIASIPLALLIWTVLGAVWIVLTDAGPGAEWMVMFTAPAGVVLGWCWVWAAYFWSGQCRIDDAVPDGALRPIPTSFGARDLALRDVILSAITPAPLALASLRVLDALGSGGFVQAVIYGGLQLLLFSTLSCLTHPWLLWLGRRPVAWLSVAIPKPGLGLLTAISGFLAAWVFATTYGNVFTVTAWCLSLLGSACMLAAIQTPRTP